MPQAIIPHRGQRKKTLEARQAMLPKMADYFVSHGFVSSTLDEMAEQVGCSRSTLAQIYFPAQPNLSSKEHVLLYVLRWVTQTVGAQLQRFQEPSPHENISEREWGLNMIDEMEKFCGTFPAVALPYFIAIEYYGQNSAIDKEIQHYYRLYRNPLHCFFHHVLDNERADNYAALAFAMLQGAAAHLRYPKQAAVLDIVFDRLRCDWEQGTESERNFTLG